MIDGIFLVIHDPLFSLHTRQTIEQLIAQGGNLIFIREEWGQ